MHLICKIKKAISNIRYYEIRDEQGNILFQFDTLISKNDLVFSDYILEKKFSDLEGYGVCNLEAMVRIVDNEKNAVVHRNRFWLDKSVDKVQVQIRK